MKKVLNILIALFFLAVPQLSQAQFDVSSTEYRIVAVKNSGDQLQSASNVISVYKQFKVDLPTAFTPNNDGLNDTFGGKAIGLSDYKLLIYDRNGAIIFRSESPENKWDGTYNGTQVQSGSYIYQLSAIGPESAKINKTGKVMVII